MRGALNSDLYGPLQDEYLKGKAQGTDVWIHKNRCVLPLTVREYGQCVGGRTIIALLFSKL